MSTNPGNPFATVSPKAAAPQNVQAPQMVAPQAAPQMVAPQAPQMMAAPQAPQMVNPLATPQVTPQADLGQAGELTADKPKRRKSGGPRKTPNRQMTKEERVFVVNNYATKTTGQIATELDLTRQQVYRTVHESRIKIKERIEAANAAGDIETAQKWHTILVTKLPEKDSGTAGGGGRAKGSSIESVVDSLLDF